MRRTALSLAVSWILLTATAQGARAADREDFQRELSRGLVLLEVGQHAEALSALRRASRMQPERIDLRLRVAALEARLGEDGLAEKHLRELLAKDPDQTDALRELGGLLVARNRPNEAEMILRRTIANRSQDGVAHFYLGLALFAQEKEADARASFVRTAALQKSLASQAHYHHALSHLRTGEAKEARERLLAAVGADSDEPTVLRAKRAIEEMDRREAQGGKRWDLSLVIGAMFDSNVPLLPDLAGELPLPPGTNLIEGGTVLTTAAAARLSTEIAFEGRPIMGKHTVGLGGGIYQSKHIPESVLSAFAPPVFDQTALGAYAYYAFNHRIGTMPMRAEISAGLVESLLDTFRQTNHFLQTPWVRPSFSLAYTRWGALRFSYRAALQNFATGNLEGTREDRDGLEHVAQLENFFLLGRRVDLRLGLLAGFFGADGDNWDTTFTGVALDARVRILAALELWGGVDYFHRDFLHSNYGVTGRDLTTTREVQRVDDRVSAFARLRMGGQMFSVSLLYTFVRNVSSASAIFGYTRHIAGVEAGFNF
jgi:Tfp pilus assembly protein PilF